MSLVAPVQHGMSPQVKRGVTRWAPDTHGWCGSRARMHSSRKWCAFRRNGDRPWFAAGLIGCAVLMIVRTSLEDNTLQAELPGYQDYARHTRYRLLPGEW
jgi:hypothetical protein